MNRYMLNKTGAISGFCLTLYCVLGCSVAFAHPLMKVLPVNSVTRILNNSELSQIVGRGVIGGKIVYFGVEMQTNWTSNTNHATITSTMNVAFNSQKNIFVPTITYTTQGDVPAVSSPVSKINGEGLKNIQGVAQAIQIGGNNNTVKNGISLNVINGAPVISKSGDASLPIGTKLSNDGVTVTAIKNQLSMALNNGSTSIRQGIGSSGIFQISQVGSNMNNIQNQLTLTLGVNPVSSSAQNLAQLQSIIGSMNTMQGFQ